MKKATLKKLVSANSNMKKLKWEYTDGSDFNTFTHFQNGLVVSIDVWGDLDDNRIESSIFDGDIFIFETSYKYDINKMNLENFRNMMCKIENELFKNIK